MWVNKAYPKNTVSFYFKFKYQNRQLYSAFPNLG
jgi:hypothetical protein